MNTRCGWVTPPPPSQGPSAVQCGIPTATWQPHVVLTTVQQSNLCRVLAVVQDWQAVRPGSKGANGLQHTPHLPVKLCMVKPARQYAKQKSAVKAVWITDSASPFQGAAPGQPCLTLTSVWTEP